jgi:hypothetical protein
VNQSRFFRRHPAVTRFGVTAVACALALAATEGFLAWRHTPIPAAPNRSIRLREYQTLTDMRMAVPDEVVRDPASELPTEVSLRVDIDGFIEPSRVHEEPDLSVVFLGGSSTECLWVPERQRFPYLVGRLLEQSHPGTKVNSFNGGRSANHSLHSIAALLGKVIPLAPDVCVMMHNCNDLAVLMYGETYWNTRIDERDMLEKRWRHESVFSRTRALVYQIIPRTYELIEGLLTGTAGAVQDDMASLRSRRVSVDRAFVELYFRRSLRTFIEMCRIWDIEPVLMTQANRITKEQVPHFSRLYGRLEKNFGLEYAGYFELYHRMNDVIRDIGKQHGVQVIDLAAAMPQDAEHLYDPFHLTSAGSQLAATIICPALAPRLQARALPDGPAASSDPRSR